MEIYGVTPFPEGIGSLGNALYFVVLVGVGALLLYMLVKRKSRRLINLITGFALTVAVFMLSVVYLSAVFSNFAVVYADVLILTLSLLVTVSAYFAIFRARSGICNFTVLCLGGALGTFLGF